MEPHYTEVASTLFKGRLYVNLASWVRERHGVTFPDAWIVQGDTRFRVEVPREVLEEWLEGVAQDVG